MNPDFLERLKRVSDRQTATLIHCGRRTGNPHNVTIRFVLDGEKLYLATANVNRRRIKNVKETPRIKLSIAGETFSGKVRFITDRAEHEHALLAIRRKLDTVR